MRNPQEVVLQPLLTEKTTTLRELRNVYCFKVHRRAGKIEIARALETLFAKDKIKVAEVRTAIVRGKARRMGRFIGRRHDWKKAWVRLTADSKPLEFFEAS